GQFNGPRFHSAQWRHDVDCTGKSVAVIGNGASAVQLIPRLAAQVRQLVIFQRTANWIIPKNDHVYTDLERARFAGSEAWTRMYRYGLWAMLESTFLALRRDPLMSWFATQRARRHLESQVSDPTLRKALLPDYPLGAKRILISDDYYPTLAQ